MTETVSDAALSTPFTDLVAQARKHYEELSSKAMYWSSSIPHAIDAWEREPDLLSELVRLRTQLATAEVANATLRTGLDKLAYTVFVTKRMQPEFIPDHLLKAYDAACLVLNDEPVTVSAEAEREVMREALNAGVIALGDWLAIYADDYSDPARVAEARKRIEEYSIIGYITRVTDLMYAALVAHRGTVAEAGEKDKE